MNLTDDGMVAFSRYLLGEATRMGLLTEEAKGAGMPFWKSASRILRANKWDTVKREYLVIRW